MPGVFRCDRGDYARMLFYFACEAAGASSARHSLRPLNFRWLTQCKTRADHAARSRKCVGNAGALSLPLLWGGWREAPGGGSARKCAKTSIGEVTPARHIVRSAHDVTSLPTRGRDKKERDCARMTNFNYLAVGCLKSKSGSWRSRDWRREISAWLLLTGAGGVGLQRPDALGQGAAALGSNAR